MNRRILMLSATAFVLLILPFLNISANETSSSPAFCFPYITKCNSDKNPTGPTDLPGSWTQGSFSNRAGSRNYFLYVPKSAPSGNPTGLMVMLHGCFQDPESFSRETGMNYVAEKFGFAVLYPEQTNGDNLWQCWNWFLPENQVQGGGELGLVVGMVEKVAKKVAFDPKKVYVAGLSAGAAMASNLVACHAEVFAGAGIHSGLEYKD